MSFAYDFVLAFLSQNISMHFHLLRVYFKAAVVIPFYTACFFVLMTLLPLFIRNGISLEALKSSLLANLLLKDVLWSGLIGLCTLSCFLNCYEKIAYHAVYRVLAWMLLPYSFILYVLLGEIDWTVMNFPGTTEMIASCLLLILCFLHVIGIIISFIDFRATILNQMKEENKRSANSIKLKELD